MAQYRAIFTGQFPGGEGFNRHPSMTLSGPDSNIPDYAIIREVILRIRVGVGKYNRDLDANFNLYDSEGAFISVENTVYETSSPVWQELGGIPDKALNWNGLSSVSLYGSNNLFTRDGSTSEIWVDYDEPTVPGQPLNLKITPNSVAGGTAVLSWDEAEPGINNPVAGYEVWEWDIIDGRPLSYVDYTNGLNLTVDSAFGNGSVIAYAVKTIGTISGIDSIFSNDVRLKTEWSTPSKPGIPSLSANNVPLESAVTLSWTASVPGTNNPPRGYEIYRSVDGGSFDYIGTVDTTSATVYAPDRNNRPYTYKVKALGTVNGSDSDFSDVSAEFFAKYTDPAAPTDLALSNNDVLPGASVTLTWAAALQGVNNPVKSYKIFKSVNGETPKEVRETTERAINVQSADGNGSYIDFTVQAFGAVSGTESAQSAPVRLRTTWSTPGTPGTPALSTNNVGPNSPVTLSWTASVDGINNPVMRYEVYRSVDGQPFQMIDSVFAPKATVYSPIKNGLPYTFQVRAIGTVSGSDSGLSEISAALFCVFTAPSVPSNLLVNGEKNIFVDAGSELNFTWSASSNGQNNAVTAYVLMQDGSRAAEVTNTNAKIKASYLYGNINVFNVRARGQFSDSQPSENVTVTINVPPAPPRSIEAVSDFIFFDKDDQPLFIRDDAIELIVTEEEFRCNGVFPYDPVKEIVAGMKIGWIEDKNLLLFEIRQPTTDAVLLTQTFEAENAAMAELLDEAIEDKRPRDVTAAEAAERALEGTQWQVGEIKFNGPRKTTNFYMTNVWESLLKIRDEWGAAISPRIYYAYPNTMIRFIDILDRRGENRGVRLTLDLNAQAAGVSYDDRGLYTALIGQGESPGEGQHLITFADAYWSVNNGDPANKPIGQKWVEDEKATEIFGRHGRKRVGFVQFNTTDPMELLKLTWQALQVAKAPRVTIDMTAFNLASIGYAWQGLEWGDDVVVELDNINVELSARITQFARDVLRPENSKPVIGDYRPDIVFEFAKKG